jgi:uncharacterized protein (TIGR03032 family)
MNSIAPGASLRSSYFTASCDAVSTRRPGHHNFAVDGRGVVFSGATRDVCVRGLTRPHSARIHRASLWVANSGYGEVGVADGPRFASVARLPGWTRGLCFAGDVGFAGTSRVLPRFRHYAPGLDVDEGVCGVHAIDVRRGTMRGSLVWPKGNQIFAIDWAPSSMTLGFPFTREGSVRDGRRQVLFYSFRTRSVSGAR